MKMDGIVTRPTSTLILKAALVVVGFGALASPERAQATTGDCKSTGTRQCEFTRPCVEWVGSMCTKWGEGSWSYYPAAE
jgi:hypothetical protein